MSAPEQQSATGVPDGYPGSYAGDRTGAAAPRNGLGLTGMVLGIVSVALCFAWYLAAPASVVGLVLSILGRKRVLRGEATNSRQALAGIILNALGLVLAVLVGVAAVAWLATNRSALGL